MNTSSDRPGEENAPGGEDFFDSTWEPEPSALVGCEHLESVAAELALGSLTGAERSVRPCPSRRVPVLPPARRGAHCSS